MHVSVKEFINIDDLLSCTRSIVPDGRVMDTGWCFVDHSGDFISFPPAFVPKHIADGQLIQDIGRALVDVGDEALHRLIPVFLRRRHGLCDAGDELVANVMFLEFIIRETIIEDVGGFGRPSAGEHFKQCCPQGIHIHGDGKVLPLLVAGLLHGGISRRATTHLRARLRLAVLTILLGEAEVDEDRFAALAHHDVGGFEVKVEHALLMHEGEGVANLLCYPHRLILRDAPLLPDEVVEAPATDVLHDVVDGVVRLEGLQHLDDVGMLEFAQVLRLSQEFLLVVVVDAAIAAAGHQRAVAPVEVAQEEFLDGDLHISLNGSKVAYDGGFHHRQIGDAKRPLSQLFNELVLVRLPLEHGALR